VAILKKRKTGEQYLDYNKGLTDFFEAILNADPNPLFPGRLDKR
jgi:hypothetical protein